MALRYFSGGDPLDILDIHGVKMGEVLESVWEVVDAVHKSHQLEIMFPECHDKQLEIVQGFEKKSDINISNWVGAIDGILIWINKSSMLDEKAIKFGPSNSFVVRRRNLDLICRRLVH